MARYQAAISNRSGFWRAFGHSYLESQLGTVDQTGRPDAVFRDILSVLSNEWQNWAVTGSRVMIQGVSQGGYARVFSAVPGVARGGPYISSGGASLLYWGINDLGLSGPGPTYLAAYIDAMRAVISRLRMSAIKENTDASIVYGAGFTLSSGSGEWTSGGSYRTATATTGSTITITLPSDYDGSPVVLCFNGIFNGGTGTFSGTAGVTGTFTTSGIIPVAVVSHCPRVKRITNLTAANAGQTIIFTATAFDASGTIDFDCWWIESPAPSPVIVCDLAKLNALGYSSYAAISGNSVAVNDAFVDTWNAALYVLCAEFDDMVQIAYCDDVLAKNANYIFAGDGVHPNEFGSAQLADAMATAVDRLTPAATSVMTRAAYINPPSPRGGSIFRSHRSGFWYTAEYDFVGTAYALVAGDMFAMPFQVTSPRLKLIQLAIEVVTASATTQATIRWGVYDDPGQSGYPFSLMQEPSASAAFGVGLTTGAKLSPASPGANSLTKPLDPGLFWLVILPVTTGTGVASLKTLAGQNLSMPNTSQTGLGLTGSAGFMGYKLTGQATGSLPSSFPAGAALVAEAPYIAFKTA